MIRRLLSVLLGILLRARRRRHLADGMCPAWGCSREVVSGHDHCEVHRPAKRACCLSGCVTWILGIVAYWYWETHIRADATGVWLWLDQNIFSPIGRLLQDIGAGL